MGVMICLGEDSLRTLSASSSLYRIGDCSSVCSSVCRLNGQEVNDLQTSLVKTSKFMLPSLPQNLTLLVTSWRMILSLSLSLSLSRSISLSLSRFAGYVTG